MGYWIHNYLQEEENPMSKSKLFVPVAALAVLAMLLSACGPAPTPETVEVEVEVTRMVEGESETVIVTATPEPEAPKEEVTIQLWSTAWFPSSIDGRIALVEKFNEEYKGKIQVEYIQGDWGQVGTYVQSGVAAGGGIACVVEYEVEGGAQDFYMKHWIQDLRPFMTPERWELMTEDQWEARTFPEDGAIVANGTVLWEPMQLVLYNPAHFEAAGVEPGTVDDPWTWEELVENAKLLTLDGNGNHLGEDGFDSSNVVQWGFLPRLDLEKVWEYGLRFAQQRMGKPVVREEDGVWGWYLDEAGAEVYEKFLTVLQEGVSPQLAIGLGGDSLHQALADGTASMILRETFGIALIRDNYPDFELAAMPTPFNPGDTMFYKSGGEGAVMTVNCEHPEEAAEFMFWMMKPENLAPYAYANGMLPANYAALDEEPFASDPTWDIIKDYLARGEVFTTAFNPFLDEFKDTVAAPTLMEVVEGTKTFAEANAILAEQATLLLNQEE